MENAHEISTFIQDVGVPVATAIGLGGALWWIIKYVLSSIVQRISEAQSQTEADIKDLKVIIVGLIDKTTQAQGALIRLDTLLRVRYGLDPDEKRIARNPNGKKK